MGKSKEPRRTTKDVCTSILERIARVTEAIAAVRAAQDIAQQHHLSKFPEADTLLTALFEQERRLYRELLAFGMALTKPEQERIMTQVYTRFYSGTYAAPDWWTSDEGDFHEFAMEVFCPRKVKEAIDQATRLAIVQKTLGLDGDVSE